MTKKSIWFPLVALVFSSLVAAEETGHVSTTLDKLAAKPTTTSPVKASISSSYYNMEGTRAADGDKYSFGKTELNLQLLTLQYQLAPTWTLVGVGQYLRNRVITGLAGQEYDDTTEGFGDSYLSAVHPLAYGGKFLLLMDAGASLPTGGINYKNKSNPGADYPFNMQLGSGTVDPMVGLTSLWNDPDYQIGSRLSSLVRMGHNSKGYRVGNQYKLDAWANYNLGAGFTPRLVGYYKYRDPIVGEDDTVGRNRYTEYYYHTQINWDLSAALKYEYAILPTLALGGEFGAPLAQDCINSDHVVISTNYYGNLFLNGSF